MRNPVGVLGVLLGCLLLSSTAQATLLSRLGGAAAYDDVLDITWLTDASALGTGTWQQQVDAAAALDTLGFDDWRLSYASVAAGAGPITSLTTGFSCTGDDSAADELACRDNEMAYMFYYNLDGAQGSNQTGSKTVGVGVDAVTLNGIQSFYWSGTEFNFRDAWGFFFNNGSQDSGPKDFNLSGWAVRSGDVVGVPEPGTMLLMAASLGLFGFRRSQRRP
jgi:hypothetical protein